MAAPKMNRQMPVTVASSFELVNEKYHT
jgi:hypothetical protein